MNRKAIQRALWGTLKGNGWNEFVRIHGDNLTLELEDFCIASKIGDNKGKTALWRAIAAALNGDMEPWNFIQARFADELTLEHFCVVSEAGDNKGKTALWLVIAAAVNGDMGLWNFIQARFADELTLEDFNVANNEGETVLWLVMEAVFNGYRDPWDFIQEHFPHKLILEDFRVAVKAGENKGKTALWLAIESTIRGRMGLWNFIQAHSPHKLTLEDFRVAAEAGNDKGKTLLWLAIVAATHGHMEPWDFIQSRFAEEVKLEDFLVATKIKQEEPLIVVVDRILLDHIMALPDEVRIKILSAIMSRFFFVHEDMNVEGFSGVYKVKKALIEFLDKIKLVEPGSAAFKELLRLAESAYKQGFLEAYYMAAVHEKMAASKEAMIELLLKVDQSSLHYERANQLGLAESIALLWKEEKELSDHQLFHMAASFCFRLKDLEACKELFKCYVYKRSSVEKAKKIVDEGDAFLGRHKFYKKMNTLIHINGEGEVLAPLIIQSFDLIAEEEENKDLKEMLMTPLFDAGVKREREATSTGEEPPMKRMNSGGGI